MAIAVEQRHGVFLREVFELQQHVRPAGFNRLDNVVDKLIVLVVGNTRVTPAHIQRIVQQLLVVGTDVQHHRQRVGRADTAAGGIQRQFTDRNAHPADTLVTEAENTFAVGHHDHLDVVVRHVLQNIVEVIAVLIRDKHAAGATIDLREAFTGGADGRGVDNRHHFVEVVADQAVEQRFVGILDIAQVDVLVDLGFKSLVLDPRAFGLLFNGFDHFRQQTQQVEAAALFHAEGATFVEQRKFKQHGAGVRDVKRAVFLMGELHRTNSLIIASARARRQAGGWQGMAACRV